MSYESTYDDSVLYDSYDDSYEDSNDDSYDDDYPDDYDDYSERRRGGIFGGRRRAQNAQPARGGRMGRTNQGAYRGQGTIETPAGKAKVNLPPDLVSKKEFKELEAKVLANNKAILKNGKAIEVLNGNTKRLDAGLAAQGKTVSGLQKNISGIQQGQMFSALLPPKLEKVKVYGGGTADITTIPKDEANAIDVKVKSSSFDTLNTLLPLMFSGSMGGGSGSLGSNNNMNMMLPMVLILTNKDNDDDKKDDNTMLLVAMMMMMNNK